MNPIHRRSGASLLAALSSIFEQSKHWQWPWKVPLNKRHSDVNEKWNNTKFRWLIVLYLNYKYLYVLFMRCLWFFLIQKLFKRGRIVSIKGSRCPFMSPINFITCHFKSAPRDRLWRDKVMYYLGGKYRRVSNLAEFLTAFSFTPLRFSPMASYVHIGGRGLCNTPNHVRN